MQNRHGKSEKKTHQNNLCSSYTVSCLIEVKVYLQVRQIFKFGLLRKKDNKKNLKIRLVLRPKVIV